MERGLTRMGLKDPQLQPDQLQLPFVRRGRTIASLIGISAGCILGMSPLFFIS